MVAGTGGVQGQERTWPCVVRGVIEVGVVQKKCGGITGDTAVAGRGVGGPYPGVRCGLVSVTVGAHGRGGGGGTHTGE